MDHPWPVSESVSVSRAPWVELQVMTPRRSTILGLTVGWPWVILHAVVTLPCCGQTSCPGEFFFSLSINLLGGFLVRLFSVTHHEDFPIAIRVKLWQQGDLVMAVERPRVWSALSSEGSGFVVPNVKDPCPSCASFTRPLEPRLVEGGRCLT
jgi:hypothetical protein